MAGVRGLVGVLASLSIVALGCGAIEQKHGYVQSSDGSLSFRHPIEWQEVELDPITTEWVTGLDASDQPSQDNLLEFLLDEPFLVAQVLPLDPSVRDEATLSSLLHPIGQRA